MEEYDYDKIQVRFMSLSGPFKVVKTEQFSNNKEALKAAEEYAKPAGFTNIKLVDGEDPYDGARITGKTPGGRGGRNIAFID